MPTGNERWIDGIQGNFWTKYSVKHKWIQDTYSAKPIELFNAESELTLVQIVHQL
jgi:hypothetical protein